MEHLAARFCTKEAVVKVLGMDGFDPLEIDVVGSGGAPRLELHGDVRRRARRLGAEVRVSLTHVQGMAAAVAFAIPPASRGQGAARVSLEETTSDKPGLVHALRSVASSRRSMRF
jgi:hypothetical protein